MRSAGFWTLAVLLASAAPAANDPCQAFKWDVSRERALFATAGATLPAGKDLTSAPGVMPDHLYRLVLLPASQVVFPTTPGKASPTEGSYAGIFTLTVPAAGRYRVALDSAFWVDIAASGRLVPAVDYEGQHDCRAPRKIVEFVLDGKAPWVLQLSGSSQAAVRLTITSASAG